MFESNNGSIGCGILVDYSSLEFYGMVVFQNNTCNCTLQTNGDFYLVDELTLRMPCSQ